MTRVQQLKKIDEVLAHPDIPLFIKEAKLAGFRTIMGLSPVIANGSTDLSIHPFLGLAREEEGRMRSYLYMSLGSKGEFYVWGDIEERFEKEFDNLDEAFDYFQGKVHEL